MSIIRVQKFDCFAQIPNSTLQDTSISLEAKGLLCFMLSKPTDWHFYKQQVMKDLGCSTERFNRIWNELITAGYIDRRRKPVGNLKHYDYVLHDVSILLKELKPLVAQATAFQSTEVQSTEVQSTENHTPTKTDLTKTDRTKTDEVYEQVSFLISKMQEIRTDSLGDKFQETKRQTDMMGVLVRQHGEQTVGSVMEWAMTDSWWASIIITPSMLHKHFGKLKLQSNKSIGSTKTVYEQYLENNPEEGAV